MFEDGYAHCCYKHASHGGRCKNVPLCNNCGRKVQKGRKNCTNCAEE